MIPEGLKEWIMYGTPFAIGGLGWVMKVKTKQAISEEVESIEERMDAQRSKDKTNVFEHIRSMENKLNEHDVNIRVLLERSSSQAAATQRIDGHIKELSGKMDDLKDLLIEHLGKK